MLCFTPTKGKLKILHYATASKNLLVSKDWCEIMIWLIQHKVSFVQQPKYVNCPGIKEIIRSVHVSYKHDWMTVWEHKSLQVLISGNLCLKVKHFSSSGPILVTAQPLSVIHSLPPALRRERTANPKCQVPAGRTQEVQSTQRGPTPLTWWGTEGITKTAVTPAHHRVFEKQAE